MVYVDFKNFSFCSKCGVKRSIIGKFCEICGAQKRKLPRIKRYVLNVVLLFYLNTMITTS